MIRKEKIVQDIPAPLKDRYIKLFAIGVMLLILGAFLAFLKIGTWYITLIIFSSISFAILAIGAVYKHRIETTGFECIEGEITYIAEIPSLGNSVNRKKAISCHIKSNDGSIYILPLNKTDAILPLYSVVRIYTPKDVKTYKTNGLSRLETIYAYELIAESSLEQ